MRFNSDFNREFINYSIVFFIIACSGIPFFVSSYYLMPFAFLIVIITCMNRGCKILDKRLIFVLLFLIFIVVIREIINGYEPSLYQLVVIILKYSFPFFVIKLLKTKFLFYYRYLIYLISVLSLIIFFSINVFPEIEDYLINNVASYFNEETKAGFYSYAPNILIYTFNEPGRNHGPFWEAGGFGVFLIIAIIFHLIEGKNLLNRFGIVYIVTSITTFSTATYVALGLLLAVSILKLNNRILRLLLIAILFILFVIIYNSADFLRNKILVNYEAIYGKYENRVANRFTSILLDYSKIKDNPIFGNPQNTGETYSIFTHRNNGLSSIAVEYGLVYFTLFFVLIYKSLKQLLIVHNKYNLVSPILFMLAIGAIYFGQVLTDKPMLLALIMFPFFIGNFLKERTLYRCNYEQISPVNKF